MKAGYAIRAGAAALVVATVLALLLWPGSPEPETATARSAQHTASLTVNDPRQGPNTLDFAVTGADGRPLPAHTLTAELAMPQMGHALPPVIAERTGPGRYRAPGTDIPMPGQWEVTLSLPGGDKVVLPLSVNGNR
ncbi:MULTISPECIES: FixH family protein [unclassified Streptomyces]|uniref:FixH family protein n=1 Tax=Streptomyces sp. NPDC006678 TaxID=3157185 RepID=UPI0033D483ED